ncbi:hypothetical protein [Novosphingobium nitrogenifigens]|nr:hypothetical protein [Novosphingobium nitrogenifigens]
MDQTALKERFNVLVIFSIFAVTIFGIMIKQPPVWPSFTEFGYFKLIGIIIIFISYGSLTGWIRLIYVQIFTTSWWNLSSKIDDPTWRDVLDMTLGELKCDPISYVNKSRKPSIGIDLIVVFALIATFSAAFETQALLSTKRIVALFNTTAMAGLKFADNLTAFLALVAAIASIYFTHRQLQAKVKADSRQAWIEKLRGNIARFVALADVAFQYPHKDRMELTFCRMEMELMLNPSEKDHRLLMYLTIKLAFFNWSNADFMKVDDVKNLLKELEPHRSNAVEQWSEILSPIPNIFDRTREDQYGKLIGYVMRLSHVVLKREWERVKATR